MFTVKSTDQQGHNVYQCAAYRFDFETKPNIERPPGCWEGPLVTLMDANDVVLRQIMVVQQVFVMNDAGRTVDTFRAPTDRS